MFLTDLLELSIIYSTVASAAHLEEAVRKGGQSRMAVFERRALRHAWKRSSVTSLR